jgi:cytochrome c-type biogenesis protein
MIDPIAAAMLALTSQAPAGAVLLVFLAGAVTSVGPCIAPRYIAIAALVNGDRRPLAATTAFVLGLVGAFVSFGFIAGLLGTLWTLSGALYLILSATLITAGCVTLVRAAPHRHGESCAHTPAAVTAEPLAPRSLGAIFLLGASSALVVSPCCTPIVAAIVGTSSAIGKPAIGALLLFCYAAGHALPLFFAGSIGTVLVRVLPRGLPHQATGIVSAVLMLALGMYYGVLA